MQEIARLTYQYTTYDEVMAMLWKRMFENKKNWRRIYKVPSMYFMLVRLLEFRIVLKNGNEALSVIS